MRRFWNCTPFKLIARMENGIATGDIINSQELVAQVKELEYDALGIATPITIDNDTLATYWRSGGVNPVGGVEALATRLIGEALDKPCAHGPVDYALTGFKEVVDPRIAVEIITENFIHCLLKGLHKAPRLSRERGMSNKDVDCMVSPYGCFGTPHQACLDANIPVIVVRENKSCLNHPEHPKFIHRLVHLPMLLFCRRNGCGTAAFKTRSFPHGNRLGPAQGREVGGWQPTS